MTLEAAKAQAAQLATTWRMLGWAPVVGRLWHSPRRWSYVVRFQEAPGVETFDDGSRFEPVGVAS